jgi:di/tripeptidase
VAQMMAEFADVINAMQSETKVLSKVEIKELLGINHISDAIDIGLLGEFESDHMTAYVADKSTAALILRRLDHLKAEMPRLIQHQRSDKRLVNDVVKEFIKLSDVLAKFPQNLILEGEKHAKKLPSSFFPPIV